ISYTANDEERNVQLQKTFEWFGRMKKRGIKPDSTTFNELILGCGRANQLVRLLEVKKELETTLEGLPTTDRTHMALIEAFGQCQQLDLAEEQFQMMREKGMLNEEAFEKIIYACCRCQQRERGFGYLNEVISLGMKPT